MMAFGVTNFGVVLVPYPPNYEENPIIGSPQSLVDVIEAHRILLGG
ncbi:MAG: hypothetical protein H9847_07670 [Candidatus Anaerobiospirillum pullicola]|uniref:Uncharacterized protein n=1 Tax=Candidatus Anaerobiospirillum pullicola TaxID=2838451 RepID=A0A948X013_9GAMM|nr:hypothetical protein [Candidatus Anaerobiospirillum pullicola]